MEDIIKEVLFQSIETKKRVMESLVPEIEKSANILIEALRNNKKILVCGNGGSAADAQHFVAELTIRFEKNRKSLPAIALTTNISSLTACSNDYEYKDIFKKQLESLGNSGDVLVGITTSGNSENIIEAFKLANEKNLKTICLNGKDGGRIKELITDLNLIVPSKNTARIQESHITIIHIWCKLIEENLFQKIPP
jgi:D-sedoheptulose 7-phosphate isomerase